MKQLREQVIATEKNVLARIMFYHVNRGELAYVYERDLVHAIGKVVFSANTDAATSIRIGDVIEIQGEMFKIKNIALESWKETYDFRRPVGINIYGVGELLPCNFQISCIVDDCK